MFFHKCSRTDDLDKAYGTFKEMFVSVIDQHTTVKTEFVRGN